MPAFSTRAFAFVARTLSASLIFLAAASTVAADEPSPPAGFTSLFNGKDLSGWWARRRKTRASIWR